MKITTLRPSSQAAPVDARGEHTLTTRVEVGLQRVFRQTLLLRIPTSGVGARDRLIVAPAETVLKGVFQPLDFDALHVVAAGLPPDTARVTGTGGAVRIELDAPRELREVRVSPATVGPFYWLEAYRLDGDAVAGKPTVSVQNRQQFLVLADAAKTVDAVVSRPSAFRETAAGAVLGVTTVIDAEAHLFSPNNVFVLAFADQRLELRLTDRHKNPVPLDVAQVHRLGFRGYPTGPRLGIAVGTEAPSFFWRAEGEIDKEGGAPASSGNADAGGLLAAELTRLLDRLPSPLPPDLEMTLVLESDAPCRFTMTEFQVTLFAVREGFSNADREDLPDPETKKTLRFGGPDSRQSLELSLPPGAAVRTADLRTTESFEDERPVGGARTEAATLGVHLSPGRGLAAQSITPLRALTASGVAVQVMALTDGATAEIALQDDQQGRPSGRTIGKGSVPVRELTARTWIRAGFAGADKVALSRVPYWLVVTARDGAFIWLSGSPTADDPSTPLLYQLNGSGTWDTVPTTAAYRLLSETADPDQPPVSLRLAGTVIPGDTPADAPAGTRTYDLAPHLLPGAADSALLIFEAATTGILTVYPPRIEYDFHD